MTSHPYQHHNTIAPPVVQVTVNGSVNAPISITVDASTAEPAYPQNAEMSHLEPYELHKQETVRVVDLIPSHLRNRSSLMLMASCGSYLAFRHYRDDHRELHRANWCRQRLCPMCAWRLSVEHFARLMQVMPNYKSAIHVVLTTPNVEDAALAGTIHTLLQGSNQLWRFISHSGKNTRHPDIPQKIVRGRVRTLEVHRGKDGLWHPHIHELWIPVDNYGTDNGPYLAQQQLSQIWGDLIGVDKPIVWMRGIKPRHNRQETAEAVLETSKYICKPGNLQTGHDFAVLHEAVYGKRIWTVAGCVRDDLARIPEDLPEIGVEGIDYVLEHFRWLSKIGYVATKT